MRRLILGLALIATLCWLAADHQLTTAADEPESLGAKATRTKKLKQKLKVEFDSAPLRNILDELPDLVNASGAGTLRIQPLAGSGVTLTSRFTVKGEKTLEEILETIVNDKSWGWYVVTAKAGDQNDGAILITTNPKEHGYKEGSGPMKEVGKKEGKKEVAKKDEPKEKMKEEPKTGGGDEKTASELLTKAKFLKSTKQLDKCKETLNEIITKYGDTKAAAEAKKLLETLGK
jgi:hypothetical protein